MKGINVGRWLFAGLVAGLLLWIMEGAASMLYMEDVRAAMEAHGLPMEVTPGVIAVSVFVSLALGLTLMFFYAAVRPRFGPGPGTAIQVAVVLWFGGYLLSLLGYHQIGLFPGSLIAIWAAVGLVEMIIAAVLGAWIYREA